MQPILSGRDIAQISPANTNPTLTLGDNFASAPQRKFANYFRVATTDLIQGPFAANYLVQQSGKQRIAVIDDGKTYGAGLADQFAQQATKLGAQVVARERVGERDTDFSGVITTIRSQNPDAVYYGGEYPVAGPLSAQLAAAGLNIPLMGGDGIVDAQFVSLGGRPGDLATNVGAPPELLPSATQFIADYKAAGYAEGYSAYGALTYDATNVIIKGLATALASGDYSEAQAGGHRRGGAEHEARGRERPGRLRPVRRHHQPSADGLLRRGRQLRPDRGHYRQLRGLTPPDRGTTAPGGGATPCPPAHVEGPPACCPRCCPRSSTASCSAP